MRITDELLFTQIVKRLGLGLGMGMGIQSQEMTL